MALDDFSNDDEEDEQSDDNWEEDWNADEVEDDEFPSYKLMGQILLDNAHKKAVDVEVNETTIEGEAEEFGKLFAYMFLDYPDADPYCLEDSE